MVEPRDCNASASEVPAEPVGSISCPQYCDSPIQIRDRTSLAAARILFEWMAAEIERRDPAPPRQTKAKASKKAVEPVDFTAPDDPKKRSLVLDKAVRATIKELADVSGRASRTEIVAALTDRGYTAKEILDKLDNLGRTGEIMEPKDGIVKLI